MVIDVMTGLARAALKFVLAAAATVVFFYSVLWVLAVLGAIEQPSMYSDALVAWTIDDGGWKKFLAIAFGGVFGFLFFDHDFDLTPGASGAGGGAVAGSAAAGGKDAPAEAFEADFYGA